MRTKSAVAIDMANIAAEFPKLFADQGISPDSHIDYGKLVDAATSGSQIVSKSIYFGINTRIHSDGQAKFVCSLRYKGFDVKTKPFKEIRKKDGTIKHKADLDVEIAIDLILLSQKGQCDRIFLFSGDSDFEPLVRKIKEDSRIRVTVVSTRASISTELMDVADDVIYLEELNIDKLIYKK